MWHGVVFLHGVPNCAVPVSLLHVGVPKGSSCLFHQRFVKALCNGVRLWLIGGGEGLANSMVGEEVGDGGGMVLQCVIRVEPAVLVGEEGYGVGYDA